MFLHISSFKVADSIWSLRLLSYDSVELKFYMMDGVLILFDCLLGIDWSVWLRAIRTLISFCRFWIGDGWLLFWCGRT